MPGTKYADDTDIDTETRLDDGTGTGFGWKVILFNCSCHSFDQVEKQVILAVKCSIGQARAISNEVHSKGMAEVYKGSPEECETVAMILEDIGLRVNLLS